MSAEEIAEAIVKELQDKAINPEGGWSYVNELEMRQVIAAHIRVLLVPPPLGVHVAERIQPQEKLG